MPFPLRSLSFGIVLGAAATFLAIRPTFSDLSATGSSHPAPSSLPPAPSLPAWSPKNSVTPPTLARAEAASAVAAWFALRDSSGGVPGYPARAAALRALLARLPADAFPRLVDGLAASAKDEERRLFEIAFGAWIRRDAPSAAGWAAAHAETGDKRRFRDLAFEAMRAWSEHDAPAAATWAASFSDLDTRIFLAIRPLCTIAETSLERAVALARSFGADFCEGVLPAIVESASKKDPVGTLRSCAPELWKNGLGFFQLRHAIGAWMKQDSPAALAWLLAQPRENDRHLAGWFNNLGGDTAASRRTVADALASTPGVPHRAETLRLLFLRWSNETPQEAIAWLDKLPDSDLRIDILERSDYFRDNPQDSLPLALVMPEGANRTERLALLLGAWAKTDSDAALAWMRENGAQPGVNEAAYAVHGPLLAALAREDPQAAVAEWQALEDPKIRAASVDAIARAWGQKDPAAAFQWAETQHQAAPSRSYGGNAELLSKWAARDPETALRWVEDWQAGLPENKRDMGRGYFDSLGGTSQERYPRAATADLYSKIRDPGIRSDTLDRHLREWLTKDPSAARAWVKASPALTPAQAATLLAPPSAGTSHP